MEEKLIRRIQDEYGFKFVNNFKLVSDYTSKVYCFDTDVGRKIIKVYRDNLLDKQLISNIYLFIQQLNFAGLNVSLPIKNKSGNNFLELENTFAEIFDYLKKDEFDILDLSDFGRLISKLHILGVNNELLKQIKVLGGERNKKHFLASLNEELYINQEFFSIFFDVNEISSIFDSCINLLDQEMIGSIVIHGDLRIKNFLVCDRKIFLIDFEHMSFGPRCFDISWFLSSLSAHTLLSEETLFSFFIGYMTNSDLSILEFEKIPDFMILFQFYRVLSAFLNNSNDFNDIVGDFNFMLAERKELKKWFSIVVFERIKNEVKK